MADLVMEIATLLAAAFVVGLLAGWLLWRGRAAVAVIPAEPHADAAGHAAAEARAQDERRAGAREATALRARAAAAEAALRSARAAALRPQPAASAPTVASSLGALGRDLADSRRRAAQAEAALRAARAREASASKSATPAPSTPETSPPSPGARESSRILARELDVSRRQIADAEAELRRMRSALVQRR